MDTPKISIITVSFNSEKTIAETIESVLNQTYDNFEYLIIDGKSSDKTVEIAESYRSRFLERGIGFTLVSEKDEGIYDAMNKGILRASGEIVGIINSDDYYETDALSAVSEFYKETAFDIMYANLRVFGEGKEFLKQSKKTKRFSTRYWNHPSTFVTKKVYDSQLYACQSIYDDLNFILSTIRAGYRIEILDKTLANFRLGGVSNKGSIKSVFERINIRNNIYKKNGFRHYCVNNFVIEFGKYVLSMLPGKKK